VSKSGFFCYNNMKVVNPNNTTHTIELVPRIYPLGTIELELYNETTKVTTVVDNTFLVTDGVLTLDFDFTFVESDKFQFKLTSGTDIAYRGKLIAPIPLP